MSQQNTNLTGLFIYLPTMYTMHRVDTQTYMSRKHLLEEMTQEVNVCRVINSMLTAMFFQQKTEMTYSIHS